MPRLELQHQFVVQPAHKERIGTIDGDLIALDDDAGPLEDVFDQSEELSRWPSSPPS